METLDFVKTSLRLSGPYFDAQLNSLIDAAVLDLDQSGVTVSGTPDQVIQSAISVYCRIHFGYDDPVVMEGYMRAYDSMKTKLACCSEYKVV